MKLCLELTSKKKSIILHVVVGANNDTLPPLSSEPSALVFGEYPTFPSLSETKIRTLVFPNEHVLHERPASLYLSLWLVNVCVESKLRWPHVTKYTYKPCDLALVWQENRLKDTLALGSDSISCKVTATDRRRVAVRKRTKSKIETYNICQ